MFEKYVIRKNDKKKLFVKTEGYNKFYVQYGIQIIIIIIKKSLDFFLNRRKKTNCKFRTSANFIIENPHQRMWIICYPIHQPWIYFYSCNYRYFIFHKQNVLSDNFSHIFLSSWFMVPKWFISIGILRREYDEMENIKTSTWWNGKKIWRVWAAVKMRKVCDILHSPSIWYCIHFQLW